jgi:hypothetical protein
MMKDMQEIQRKRDREVAEATRQFEKTKREKA